MHILNIILLAASFCLIPAGVLWLCRRLPWLGKIGPVFTLYIIGIIRVVDGAVLERLCTERYRGFESPSFRILP